MTGKPVVPRARAHADIAEAIAHYRAEGGPALARRFIDGLEAGQRPSPRQQECEAGIRKSAG